MQTAAVAREKLFNMRMSAEEWDRLEFLATHYGLNAAGVLRMLIKREVDALGVPPTRQERARARLAKAVEEIGDSEIRKLYERCERERKRFDARHGLDGSGEQEEDTAGAALEHYRRTRKPADREHAVDTLKLLLSAYTK